MKSIRYLFHHVSWIKKYLREPLALGLANLYLISIIQNQSNNKKIFWNKIMFPDQNNLSKQNLCQLFGTDFRILPMIPKNVA